MEYLIEDLEGELMLYGLDGEPSETLAVFSVLRQGIVFGRACRGLSCCFCMLLSSAPYGF